MISDFNIGCQVLTFSSLCITETINWIQLFNTTYISRKREIFFLLESWNDIEIVIQTTTTPLLLVSVPLVGYDKKVGYPHSLMHQ